MTFQDAQELADACRERRIVAIAQEEGDEGNYAIHWFDEAGEAHRSENADEVWAAFAE